MTERRFAVEAHARPGLDGAWRAGRLWRSGQVTFVTVVPGDADPPAALDGVLRLGQRSFAQLERDPRILIWVAGGA